MQQRSLFFVLAIGLLVPTVAAQESFDIVIRGGRVVDGSGNPWVRADIGIVGDRIHADRRPVVRCRPARDLGRRFGR